MSANGRLPDSELTPIPGGRLRKDAAEAWNAMYDEAKRRGMPLPMPDGPDSSYRTYARQVFWRNLWCGRGNCDNAAKPGTSNHGLGIAVDCSHAESSAHRATVDAIGAKYGWGSTGSDAPWEEWHMKWQVGVWHPVVMAFLPLHGGIRGKQRASVGPPVLLLTHRLAVCGWIGGRTLKYDEGVIVAVKRFQAHHHLVVDGVVGLFTWNQARISAEWCRAHKRHEA